MNWLRKVLLIDDVEGGHFDQPAVKPQRHKFILEKRRRFFGFRLGYRFVCSCGSGSRWVETENYALQLAETHYDIVLLESHLKNLKDNPADESSS